MSKKTVILVGASLAGGKTAEELRARGFDGRVVLIGAEPELPYKRPPLTKDYLRGESERDRAYVHEAGFYRDHDIELQTEVNATTVDIATSRVTLDNGRELGYDRLLLATGAAPRRISIPGADLEGVYYLRTLADCDLLKQRLETDGHVAVVGAGWIGTEFAASARQCGLEVTVLDSAPAPVRADLRLGDRLVLPRRARPARGAAPAGRGHQRVRGGRGGRAGTQSQWQHDRM
jgi:3-phenylpropionate/trans-cinnamate dioxygenase ferredoxin reductase subunit